MCRITSKSANDRELTERRTLLNAVGLLSALKWVAVEWVDTVYLSAYLGEGLSAAKVACLSCSFLGCPKGFPS